MKTKGRLKILLDILMLILIAWISTAGMDYWNVSKNRETPVFASPVETADDGGSGLYRGIGYTIELKGCFLPDSRDAGVTDAKFYLFGHLVKTFSRE